MNLTQLNERLDQIQSEILRFNNGRVKQLLAEVEEIQSRVTAFIGAPQTPTATLAEIIPMAALEKAAILHAVAKCRNKSAAADALGMPKTTLYRRLAEYRKEAA